MNDLNLHLDVGAVREPPFLSFTILLSGHSWLVIQTHQQVPTLDLLSYTHQMTHQNPLCD